MKLIFLVLLHLTSVQLIKVQLPKSVSLGSCKNTEWLCGDLCVKDFWQCKCGAKWNTFSDNFGNICCNSQPCYYVANSSSVECPDGVIQPEDQLCHGQCKTSMTNLRNLWCPAEKKCVKENVGSEYCKGSQLCGNCNGTNLCVRYVFQILFKYISIVYSA